MLNALSSRAAPLRMRPRVLVAPDRSRPRAVPKDTTALVVGAGVAGISAAVVLAERGVSVTLLEAADTLGGRLGAWPVRLPDGATQNVEHGFHAFFRHYYTWRDVLRRADPDLRFLRPVPGYPVISRQWPAEDLTELPTAPPLNLLALAARSPSLRLRDVLCADLQVGRQLLSYDRDKTAATLDHLPAGDFLAKLGMSDRAQAMLFEVFARSFFNDQRAMSAAELVAMFHYYFLGNPEGLGFDVPDTDHLTSIWSPLAEYLRRHGADVRAGTRVERLVPTTAHQWRLELDDGALSSPHVVLALDPMGLRSLLTASGAAARLAPRLAAQAAALRTAPPFAVTRLWLDRDVTADRAPFSAVTREAMLDSISCYHRLERPSAQWATRTGGSVVELHSYACTAASASQATDRMRVELAALWPETADAQVWHLEQRLEATAPAFPPGSAGSRPGVRTEARGVRVAGDYVSLPYLAGLMERSSMSGVLAANDILDEEGAAPEPVRGIPQRGLLAGVGRPRG
ncbi:MAG: FAD-dependent oxidoreductase [Actinomycetota bacterium]|nr:FAD-dependent oxidoreductase [Actinomycetota bacterium]